jgi:hypothetical protein
VTATLLDESFFECGDKGKMSSSERTCTDNVNVVINCLSSNFFGGLEKTTNINIKAEISEATGDDLCSTVVSVLSHFSY